MSSVSQVATAIRQVVEEDANRLAYETGFLQRQRVLTGAIFVQVLVFGWMQHANSTLAQLVQLVPLHRLKLSAPGLSKRFTQKAAEFLSAVVQRVVQVRLQAEAVDVKLLRRFSAVIVEDSTQILLPAALCGVWQGCGGRGVMSPAQVKAHVRLDLRTGEMQGPELTDGRLPDTRSPFKEQELEGGSLYIADLGYFDLKWLGRMATRHAGRKRYFVTRLKQGCVLMTRSKHRLNLHALLPQQQGQVVHQGVVVGVHSQIAARLLMVRVPEEVVEQRRQALQEHAREQGREVSEEQWYLAQWTIVISNVPSQLLTLEEMLILLRMRWQIELLFKRWKSGNQVDEWRGKGEWRVLCEVYAKLIAVVMEQWLLAVGCWQDPYRSAYKAARVVKDAAQRLAAALAGEAPLETVLESICRQMQVECHLDRRQAHPNSAQLLLEGLDWHLTY